MNKEFIQAVVLALVGSGLLSTIITALINAVSGRKSRLKGIEKKLGDIDGKLVKSERDALRTQLLILMSDYPDEKQEIMKVAQHYFGVLHGNWYATLVFNKWLVENNIADPAWFDKKKVLEEQEDDF